MKKWVHKTELLEIRPAKEGEMIGPGEFAKCGDMIIVRVWPDENFLIRQRNFEGYIEVEVPNEN